MYKLKTDKDELTIPEIVQYIKDYEANEVPRLSNLWEYYLGKNPSIVNKRSSDPNNPDNRTPVPYGRKIVNTWTGYGYRPRYITYKSDNDQLLVELQNTFNENNEHIKTSINGRNTAIYGYSYELLYIDKSRLTGKPEVKFAVIDPREMILIYDYSLEPVKKMAIRFYDIDDENWKVIVYYDNRIDYFNGKRTRYDSEIKLTLEKSEKNYFGEVPVIAYYLGDDAIGIIEPVVPLIDDYDILVSDSINEFDRFSHAYLRLVGMSLTDQVKGKSSMVNKPALFFLKQRRVFEQLRSKDDVSFLTKDIPTDYVRFMSELVRDQIHIQSHVPDLGSQAFNDGVSGVAIQRLMFDFENLMAAAEAEFDTALYERIRMIISVYSKTGRAKGTFDEVTISHKRNAPLNLKEYADTALTMTQAGFSRYLCADVMPDDIIPDVEEELKRQDEDREAAIPDIEEIPEEAQFPGATEKVAEEDIDGDN